MSKHKPHARKLRLMRATKSNRRVPAWVMMRTNRAFLEAPEEAPLEKDEAEGVRCLTW